MELLVCVFLIQWITYMKPQLVTPSTVQQEISLRWHLCWIFWHMLH